MKTSRQHAFTLVECIVYMTLLVVVVGFSTVFFFRYWDDSRALGRHAQDVIAVMQAGDQWRSDIRGAHGPIEWTNGQLIIPAAEGPITYTFAKGELRRQARLFLADVKSSDMQTNQGLHVRAWHWDVELKSTRNPPLWRPLFTFEAVAGRAP